MPKMPDWSNEIPLDFPNLEKWKAENAERERIEAEYQKSLPSGIVVGKIMHFNVADGHAAYRIIRVNKNSVRLRWQALGNPDGYIDHVLGYEGTMPRQRISYMEVE